MPKQRHCWIPELEAGIGRLRVRFLFGQNVSRVVVRLACEHKPREAPVTMIVFEDMAEVPVTKGSEEIGGFALLHLESRG